MSKNRIVHQLIFLFICLPYISSETDTIPWGSVLKYPDTIVSKGRVFKLGFFTLENTTNRYFGIFYVVSEKTVVWIANKDNPINDSSSSAALWADGNLILKNGNNQTLWSTGVATTSPMNTTLQIQDTGNLLLLNNATGATIWESFSEISNTYLPTMKVSHNVKTGKKMLMSSWVNATDPQVGSFTSGIEFSNVPQSYIRNADGRPRWRSGPWNGLIFLGVQEFFYGFTDGFNEVHRESDDYYSFAIPERKFLMKLVLNSSGNLIRTVWDAQRKGWDTIWTAPANECDNYGRCGPFGRCSTLDSPICSCLTGFEPMDKNEWEKGNWSGGCKRKNQLQCSGDGFMKIPDFIELIFFSRHVEECESRCLGNCSCVAYAHDPNIGCMFWSGDLIDIQKFGGVGVDLHIRLSASELDKHSDKKLLYIIIPVVAASLGILISIFIALRWMVKRKDGDKAIDKNTIEVGERFSSDSTAIVLKDESVKVNIEELPLFTLETLANATNQFDENNLLGKGGFGSVYKGNLGNGKEIAVKRLSAASGQGMEEFMNEVVVISKIQHRNLVRLVGCCVENEEKILIYEYMPNKSLDICLFDHSHASQKFLDWAKRFNIIVGIGRGLLYLHRDSRLRIIHRDLKPSNVLLDKDWNPKISDFGMARIFGGNQDHGNTARVVGTYGYMAPEYAMEGRFSEKSDVYSFGVLMLEIVKGKKNIHYYNHERSLSLLGCAWKMWSEDNVLGFADERISSSNLGSEIGRCIQIALLCVQEFPEDRPTIQTLLSMLSYEIVDLPSPDQPVFAEKWNGLTTGSTQLANQVGYSINELTLSELHGR